MNIERDRPECRVDLCGRSAIVTGAGSGIGRATALTHARSGAQVMVNDIISRRVEENLAMIAVAGGRAIGNVADITDEIAAAGLVADAMTHWGKIDILCNDAGIMDRIEFVEDVSTEMWNRVFQVNVTGQFFMMRAVLLHMRAARNGAVVNIVSEAGLRGGAAGATYVASKHALAGLTKSFAWSHANEGIRCNGICPGAIDADITGGLGRAAFDSKGLERAMPIMKLCERGAGPQAIANAALFLASDAAYYINGVMLPVDGGWMAE
jgi:NAD(P)-dependent dehydrogenase (short-subunit alcohol dehydrogenase family)